MQLDVFYSLARTPVDGHLPSEDAMFRAFFAEVEAADRLGYGVAWVAEAHLSTATQKGNRHPVVPHWEGEIGVNTNLPLLAQAVFARTRRIEVGSAVMNVVGLGGPIAAAERVASMLALHGLDSQETRRLHVGFSAGRFDFVNEASGVAPRSALEAAAWPVVKGKLFAEAAEIFVRLLRGDALASDDVEPIVLTRADFRDDATWAAAVAAAGSESPALVPRWTFERLRIVPHDWRRALLQLVIGSHDAAVQHRVNLFLPVQVFNLSITPPEVIEATHRRMAGAYHPSGGAWQRSYLPRTAMVFLDASRARAHDRAHAALSAYWSAMDGTIDAKKVAAATDNALVGTPDDVAAQVAARFHPDDRLMLWFDFFDHDVPRVIEGQRSFVEDVVPRLRDRGIPVP